MYHIHEVRYFDELSKKRKEEGGGKEYEQRVNGTVRRSTNK